MRNISFGQILVLAIICFLLFGDFFNFKKKLITLKKQLRDTFSTKNRKKGT